jgi:ABC-type multidrug transport system fused ATPase/permease subunit
MYLTIRKLLSLLSPEERRRGYFLLAMVVAMAILDMVGIASILPFMSVLSNPDVVVSNKYLAAVYREMNFSSAESFLAFLGLTVFVLLLFSTAFKALTTYSLLRFSQMREYSISRRLVAGYLHQPYDWFLNRHSADIGKTVLSEVGQVINGSVVPMMQLIAQGAVALAIMCLLVVAQPMVAVAMILGLGAVYATIYVSSRRYLSRLGADRVIANRQRYQVTHEAFGGIKDVKVAGLEESLLLRFESPAKRYAKTQTASQLVAQLPRYALEIVAFGGMLSLATYAISLPGGLGSALPLMALYGLAGFRLLPALQQIYAHLTRIRFSGPALDRLYTDISALPPVAEALPATGTERPSQLANGLALVHVTYSYPNAQRDALNGFSMDVPAHSIVGLVGTTGSGKTTAVDILLGLLSPQAGQLLVDGVPISPINVRAWQRMVGYVPQQVFLIDDTVAANIAFGVPADQVDHAAVERAGRIANLHDFVSTQLPQGYQTAIGERGVRLSGGQRQRIGIARALYHDPEVLVLDEATSALDNLTEQAVMEAVNNLGHRKTIVLIAHRLSTVRDCDKIFILEDGKLVDQGGYTELLERNARFRAMAGAAH